MGIRSRALRSARVRSSLDTFALVRLLVADLETGPLNPLRCGPNCAQNAAPALPARSRYQQ
jgi:hypothetical protein